MIKHEPVPGEYGYDKNHPHYESMVELRRQLEAAIAADEVPENCIIRFRANVGDFATWRNRPDVQYSETK